MHHLSQMLWWGKGRGEGGFEKRDYSCPSGLDSSIIWGIDTLSYETRC